MSRLSLRMRGPVPRDLWNRIRRRFVRPHSAGAAATAVGCVALYVAAGAEPNLSGLWEYPNGVAEIYHLGDRIEAYAYGTPNVIFEARLAGSELGGGYVNLYWEEEAMRVACGDGPMPDTSFRAQVSEDFATIRSRWTRQFGDRQTCTVTSTEPAGTVFRRVAN